MPEPKLVYVIDDDTGLRTAYAAAVHKLGYEVDTAGDGQAALNLINKRMPHLILLDLLMPTMDGISFLHNLRDANKLKNLKIIVVSNFESMPETEKLGIDRYLSKTQHEPDAVAACVQQVMEAK